MSRHAFALILLLSLPLPALSDEDSGRAIDATVLSIICSKGIGPYRPRNPAFPLPDLPPTERIRLSNPPITYDPAPVTTVSLPPIGGYLATAGFSIVVTLLLSLRNRKRSTSWPS